jgi:ABC-2 type transport system permease protein
MAELTTVRASQQQRTRTARLPRASLLLLAQVRYHFRLLLRTPRAVIAGVALPAILLLVSNPKSGNVGTTHLAGLAVLGLTITAWTTHGINLVAARESGVLKRWWSTPLPPWCYFVGRIVATVLVATLAGAVTVIIGVGVYHTHITGPAALGTLVALVVGGLAWAAAATAITGIIPDVASSWPILSLTYLPVVLISGVFGAVGKTHWMQTVASYLPAQPVIDAVTRALEYSPGKTLFSARDFIVLGCWLVGSLIAARVLFRWQPTRATRRTSGHDRAKQATAPRS